MNARRHKKESSKGQARLIVGISLCAALALSGCSSSSNAPSQPAYVVPTQYPVNKTVVHNAESMLHALSRGGSAAAVKYLSPTSKFNFTKVMKVMAGCKVAAPWDSFDEGQTYSSELECADGELVDVEVSYDDNGWVTQITGIGSVRNFDSNTS